jgi:DNA-binding GntR family transcriptional regulator
MIHAEIRSAAFFVRESLETAIATGELSPGARLDETVLAARFGVSRTPVREALRELAASGIVEIRPRRGALVAMADPGRLYEMFEVMAELEAISARLASRRINAEGIAALEAAHRACEAERDNPDAYYAANEAFHQVIYRLSGNGFLAEEAQALQKRLRPYRRLQLRAPNRLKTSFAEHERIVAAIRAGDADAASLALRDHVRVQGERFSDLIASLARLDAA